MGTRRWVAELERWIGRSGQSKEDVARRSKHNTGHVFALFSIPEPNPTLQLYLDVVGVAGARFESVRNNTPAAVIERLKEIKDREKISTVKLAKKTGISRPMLATLLNDPSPNPSLVTFDRIVAALDAEAEFVLVFYLARSVRLAIAAGATNQAEVDAAIVSAVEATAQHPRHLHVVPDELAANSDDRPARHADQDRDHERLRRAEQEKQDAEERLYEANGRVAELCQKCEALQVANLALEKRRADDAAEIRKLRQERRWYRLKMFGAGLATGIGVTAVVMQARK